MTPPMSRGGSRRAETGPAQHVVQVSPLLGVRNLGRASFDYLAPDHLWVDLRVGSLVVVPFGRRMVDGVVTSLTSSDEVAPSRLRAISSVGTRRVSPLMMDLADALAAHYLAPLGACFQAVVPTHHLASKEGGPGRQVSWVRPCQDASSTALTSRQREVLTAVPEGGVTVAELCASLNVSRAVVRALIDRGALAVERRSPSSVLRGGGASGVPAEGVSGQESVAGTGGRGADLELSGEQAAALRSLSDALRRGGAHEQLLWGATGSGKTEVYLRVLQEVLVAGGGGIVLVPEIALTVQLLERMRDRLGETVAVLHSGLTPVRRAREFERIVDGTARIVVGARSAVFAPVRDLRVIILDEAHDGSYKQEEEPRYDARWVARWLSRRHGALLVEGTATPSVESFRPGIRPLEMRMRPSGAEAPAVEVIDMRRQGGSGVLAPRAVAALRTTLVAGEQAVVLLNRRGYAAYLMCEECGEVVMCRDCEISLTYHRGSRALMCHHCGRRTAVPGVCPTCSAAALRRGSPGTERVVDELRGMVPGDSLFRLDSDVVTSGTRVSEILATFRDTSPAVLVGTQMVAKGHDYPLVTLVLVADADTGLYMPDFRAAERTFQLVTQVAGRAGRSVAPGRVLVQTWNPDAPCIRMAVAREELAFYREELATRERLGYPPYRELIRLVVSGAHEDKVEAGGRHLAGKLRTVLEDVRGPARLPRVRGLERRQIVVSDLEPERVRLVVERTLVRFRAPYARRGLDIMVDVDPQWFN